MSASDVFRFVAFDHVAALGLMAGVTVDLSRTAITDPLTAVVAAIASPCSCGGAPNAVWLVLAGTAVGIIHSRL